MMAARITCFRIVSSVRYLRKDKNIISSVNSICRRCLSTTGNFYNRKFSKDHEWVDVENRGDTVVGTVGITDHAQKLLGDLVYVELPELDLECEKDEPVGVVESVKAASDVLTPVSGTIIEVNEVLKTSPETVNASAEDGEAGWMFKIELSDSDELEGMFSHDEYTNYLAEHVE